MIPYLLQSPLFSQYCFFCSFYDFLFPTFRQVSDNRALSPKYLISDIPILTFLEGFPTPLSDLSIKSPGGGESEQVPHPCLTDKEAKAQKTQFPQKDPGLEPSKIHTYILNVSFPFLSASPEPSQCSFSKHPEWIHFSKNPTQTLHITFLSVGVRNHCIALLRISSILMGFRNGLSTAQRSDLWQAGKGLEPIRPQKEIHSASQLGSKSSILSRWSAQSLGCK